MDNNINSALLTSLLDKERSLYSTEYALQWIREQNDKVTVHVNQIPFKELRNWGFDNLSLRHQSSKFFSIDGIQVNTNYGRINSWQQPIINQPEIGYLGILTKEINGVLHFLMQAKIEPGNINHVQLSPTLQATKSNYSRVHQGNAPAYLAYFQQAKREDILFDQLQSEQGARFLKKRNRNIIIQVDGDVEVLDNFIWLTLSQIKELMKYDNVVNMDTRTVISGIPLESGQEISQYEDNIVKNGFSNNILWSLANESSGVNSLNDIILFITNLKCTYELDVKQVPLSALQSWVVEESVIRHVDRKYFEIIAADIEIDNREVVHWSQPMVKPAQEGICAFVCKEMGGVIHFVVQAKLECGNFDIIELAPTVQCLTGSYDNPRSKEVLPFLNYVLNVNKEKVIFDTYQSEEGGRFYQEQNRSMIILAGDEIGVQLPANYIWMTYGQLQTFIKLNNYINIQARSLLSAIAFV
ncbi:NDP-hexose 2,3-dehydratase family protein [Parapedobacter sp. 10938]|uniref:NDP-hexose 2,3-dehydratase family protein n=1 Tax=Parapedobacter flavus TaxID=3110225 RepID=UPI002DB956FF|nr:NDP-hexose 2,3-dehydratase family protein [Parapedobacter sp. 10938]MEC3880156.1 NDP-hexose 2,3-dehydratase family protein [Parapedobacter sp. 10938]